MTTIGAFPITAINSKFYLKFSTVLLPFSVSLVSALIQFIVKHTQQDICLLLLFL